MSASPVGQISMLLYIIVRGREKLLSEASFLLVSSKNSVNRAYTCIKRFRVIVKSGVKFKDGERVETDKLQGCGLNNLIPDLTTARKKHISVSNHDNGLLL